MCNPWLPLWASIPPLDPLVRELLTFLRAQHYHLVPNSGHVLRAISYSTEMVNLKHGLRNLLYLYGIRY